MLLIERFLLNSARALKQLAPTNRIYEMFDGEYCWSPLYLLRAENGGYVNNCFVFIGELCDINIFFSIFIFYIFAAAVP